MNELIDESELFYTPFEPMLTNRFICYIPGIEPYLIYETSPIRFRGFEDPMTKSSIFPEYIVGHVDIYHAINHDVMGVICDKFAKELNIGSIVIKQLGPPGDVVSTIELIDCQYLEHSFINGFSYANDTFGAIRLQFKYYDVIYTPTAQYTESSTKEKIRLGTVPKVPSRLKVQPEQTQEDTNVE